MSLFFIKTLVLFSLYNSPKTQILIILGVLVIHLVVFCKRFLKKINAIDYYTKILTSAATITQYYFAYRLALDDEANNLNLDER